MVCAVVFAAVDSSTMSRAVDQSDVWTTRRLMGWMTQAFGAKGMESPRRLAEDLLAHVIGCERLRLYMDQDRPATPLERSTLRELVGRALQHEPVQYLTGHEWFFGLQFQVDRRVLIPRPSTETIVEQVLQHARAKPGFGGSGLGMGGEGVLIADACTGSGCIAISILKHLPGARAVATDISAEALEVAAANARRHGVSDRIDFLQGDLVQPLLDYPGTAAKGTLHYLLSNPPYIPDDEWDAVEPNVKNHEPTIALRGGMDGLDFVRSLLVEGQPLVRSGGLIMIEVAASRARQARGLMEGVPGLEDARILPDMDGLDRVIMARHA